MHIFHQNLSCNISFFSLVPVILFSTISITDFVKKLFVRGQKRKEKQIFLRPPFRNLCFLANILNTFRLIQFRLKFKLNFLDSCQGVIQEIIFIFL